MAKKTLVEITAEHKALIEKFNEEINGSNRADELTKLENSIKECEGEYAYTKAMSIYGECMLTSDPVATLIKLDHFYSLSHHFEKDKDTKVIKSADVTLPDASKSKGKCVRLDVIDFCKKKSLANTFEVAVKKLNKLMFVDAMKDIGASSATILKKNDSDNMKKVVKALEQYEVELQANSGDTSKAKTANPVSNGSLNKAIQECFDALPFKESKPKANKSKHLGYLKRVCCLSGRKPEDVKMITEGKFARLVQNVTHMAITGKDYNIIGFETLFISEEEKKEESKKVATEKGATSTEEKK